MLEKLADVAGLLFVGDPLLDSLVGIAACVLLIVALEAFFSWRDRRPMWK